MDLHQVKIKITWNQRKTCLFWFRLETFEVKLLHNGTDRMSQPNQQIPKLW